MHRTVQLYPHGSPVAVAVAIALVAPLRRAVPAAAQRFTLQLHHALGGKADHLQQECGRRSIVVISGQGCVSQLNPIQHRHDGCRPARLRQTIGGRSGGPVGGLYTITRDTRVLSCASERAVPRRGKKLRPLPLPCAASDSTDKVGASRSNLRRFTFVLRQAKPLDAEGGVRLPPIFGVPDNGSDDEVVRPADGRSQRKLRNNPMQWRQSRGCPPPHVALIELISILVVGRHDRQTPQAGRNWGRQPALCSRAV